MDVHKCPHCGESYSTTYRDCPFCEEEAAYAEGREIRRRGGRRASQREPSVLGSLLTLSIVVLCGALAYYFFGDKIMESVGLRQQGQTPPSSVEEVVPPVIDPDKDILVEPENPDIDTDVTMPSNDGTGTSGTTGNAGTIGTAGGMTLEQLKALPNTLKLSSGDFTAKVGESVKLTPSGGQGNYSWLSANPDIATVSDKGVVTGVSSGGKKIANATIYVTDGKAVGICIARVTGGEATAPATGDTQTPSANVERKLNTTDFTMSVGDAPVQLKLSGASDVSWTSDKTGVATVNAKGQVTAVAKGMTTVTASADGKSYTCIVRVS